MRLSSGTEVEGRWGCVFLILWNLLTLLAVLLVLGNTNGSSKSKITFGILGYCVIGLWLLRHRPVGKREVALPHHGMDPALPAVVSVKA